ncbi:MAG TPA: hypothetical protein VET23_03625 [Chitinophagaceae bacterium]|nr:hypothetical protein [Chitinophagaceae bacterium]
MTRVLTDSCKTTFSSADDIVSYLIKGEELIAVCPGLVIVEPMPVPSAGKKTNPVMVVIILALFFAVAVAIPKLLEHGVELILFIIALPILTVLWMIGQRLGQKAVIVTANNVWAIWGMDYDKRKIHIFLILHVRPKRRNNFPVFIRCIEKI